MDKHQHSVPRVDSVRVSFEDSTNASHDAMSVEQAGDLKKIATLQSYQPTLRASL